MTLLRTLVGIRGPGACDFRDSLRATCRAGDLEVARGKKWGARPPVAVPTLNATAAVTSAVVANTTFMADDPPAESIYSGAVRPEAPPGTAVLPQPIPFSTRLGRPALGP